MRSSQGRSRTMTNPGTGLKEKVSVIRDEIHIPAISEPPYDAGDWGKYVYGAWLEEDLNEPGVFYISFPYWRNGRFAGQYSLRAEPRIIRALVEEIRQRGWFEKKGWSDPNGPG